MNRLRCLICGHEWLGWVGVWGTSWAYRYCDRCDSKQWHNTDRRAVFAAIIAGSK